MEKTGIIFDIKRYAVHDGPGIRTTVFFKGCPLRCRWCHNPESMELAPQPRPDGLRVKYINAACLDTADQIGREFTVSEIMAEIEKDALFYEQSGGGVTFSGGEPLLQIDFLSKVLENCAQAGFHSVVDTAGYASWETLARIISLTGQFLFDLKLMDERAHIQYTGVSNRPILQNLKKLAEGGHPVRIRLPMIPGITDTDSNIDQVIAFLKTLEAIREVDLLPFNKIGIEKYTRMELPPPLPADTSPNEERLQSIRRKLIEAGFDVKIEG